MIENKRVNEEIAGETPAPARKSLPVIGGGSPIGDVPQLSAEEIEAELKAFEQSERERLGVKEARTMWVDSMTKPVFNKTERPKVNLLMGGLTAAQDFLMQGALAGIGYNAEALRVPDNLALQTGKEFGNRAQCNPTYFTVGNLVSHLISLREKGQSTEEIIANNIFVTAGACGPCRFGMYVTEYRKALRDAGFDGFRVMLFQQQGGLKQATGEEAGLALNPTFFKALLRAVVAGDVLNALGYRIRPYEVVPGATNKVLEEAKRICWKALNERKSVIRALWKCRKLFRTIEVDRLRARPKVSIIGEFWAMTTEGDGNYFLQKFLESEGGENDIQLTTAWFLYTIWENHRDTLVRSDLRNADDSRKGLKKLGTFGIAKKLGILWAAEKALRTIFKAFAIPAGLSRYKLADMWQVADFAAPYYSNDLRGGEGHMEVGKLIMNAVHSKAHITVSVKPFGCMPSAGVSDGVQSLVQNRYPGSIYCAVETSGDGATNFYSRVQMYMFKARLAAEAEMQRAYEETGVTPEQVREFLKKNKKYADPLYHPPHAHGTTGTAANLVREVAPLIRLSAPARVVRATALGVWSVAKSAVAVPVALAKWAAGLVRPSNAMKLWYDVSAVASEATAKKT